MLIAAVSLRCPRRKNRKHLAGSPHDLAPENKREAPDGSEGARKGQNLIRTDVKKQTPSSPREPARYPAEFYHPLERGFVQRVVKKGKAYETMKHRAEGPSSGQGPTRRSSVFLNLIAAGAFHRGVPDSPGGTVRDMVSILPGPHRHASQACSGIPEESHPGFGAFAAERAPGNDRSEVIE
jgi:hypothetical protein